MIKVLILVLVMILVVGIAFLINPMGDMVPDGVDDARPTGDRGGNMVQGGNPGREVPRPVIVWV